MSEWRWSSYPQSSVVHPSPHSMPSLSCLPTGWPSLGVWDQNRHIRWKGYLYDALLHNLMKYIFTFKSTIYTPAEQSHLSRKHVTFGITLEMSLWIQFLLPCFPCQFNSPGEQNIHNLTLFPPQNINTSKFALWNANISKCCYSLRLTVAILW